MSNTRCAVTLHRFVHAIGFTLVLVCFALGCSKDVSLLETTVWTCDQGCVSQTDEFGVDDERVYVGWRVENNTSRSIMWEETACSPLLSGRIVNEDGEEIPSCWPESACTCGCGPVQKYTVLGAGERLDGVTPINPSGWECGRSESELPAGEWLTVVGGFHNDAPVAETTFVISAE